MSEVALNQDFLGVFGVFERDGSILLAANRRTLTPGHAPERTYDLPGGRVEAGETMHEALRREWREETGSEADVGRFLFVQEGLRRVQGERRYAWRSFFFEVTLGPEEPQPCSEVEGLLWLPKARLAQVLTAPYHAAFLRFVSGGAAFQFDGWDS